MARYRDFTKRLPVLLFVLCIPGILSAQNPPGYRVIKVDNGSRRAPVRFGEIRCGGQEVESGVPFLDTAKDWLDGCTIQLTNYIQKTVVAAHILAVAPESGSGVAGDSFASSPVLIGQLPDWQMKDMPMGVRTTGSPIALRYRESMLIRCSEPVPSLERLAAEKGKPLSDISEVTFVLQAVDFSDGTQSQLGIDNFYKPNEAAGHGYIRIGRDEFYKGIEAPK